MTELYFMNVEDMTNAELDKETKWVNRRFDSGDFDWILMVRYEELENEIDDRQNKWKNLPIKMKILS